MKKQSPPSTIISILPLVILAFATFLRTFRLDQILGFYFDQGRDALVIADLVEKGRFFLIGPTTGIAGIFRGPFYYYLITPAYWLGKGDPLYPALFLVFTSVAALGLLYYLGTKAGGRRSGIFALILGSFSYFIIYASRWLSNPTPMLLLSLTLVWMMCLVNEGKKWAWIPLSFIAGSSLFHFGSSGEFFYFPALLIFALWQFGIFKKKFVLPSFPILLGSILAFVATAAPLFIFDLRHDRILTHNITKFFVGDASFKASFWEVAPARLEFMADVFYSKVFLVKGAWEKALFILTIAGGIFHLRTLIKNAVVKISLLLFISPWIGFLFFQGNEGNVYDYYLTGYYLIFVLLMGVSLAAISRNLLGKVVVFAVFYLFLQQNVLLTRASITDQLDGPNTIAFGNQKMALDWIFENAQGKQFNVDEYVPPVIPYSYKYLERWYTNGLRKAGIVEEESPLLYTIYEVDPPHPERLEAWLARQKGIGRVEEEKSFGGITVQRRTRI